MSASSKPSSGGCWSRGLGRPGAGPGAGPVGDRHRLDDLSGVDGKHKQGAGFGYTKVLGYHPILATHADSGEVLHARMRKGQANTQYRGARRFIDELVARVRRAGATGPLTMRMDSGFWSNDTDHHVGTGSTCATRWPCATNTKGIGRRDRHHRRGRLGRASTTPPTVKPKSPTPRTPPATAAGR